MSLIEINEQKALEWYAIMEGLSISEIEESCYTFFKSLEEVFEWVYIDENDSHQDTIEMLRTISTMNLSDVIQAGSKTIAEYMSKNWEHLQVTPFGYLKIEI